MVDTVYRLLGFNVTNWWITGLIGWVANPSLSQMQVLLKTPEFFIWHFGKVNIDGLLALSLLNGMIVLWGFYEKSLIEWKKRTGR